MLRLKKKLEKRSLKTETSALSCLVPHTLEDTYIMQSDVMNTRMLCLCALMFTYVEISWTFAVSRPRPVLVTCTSQTHNPAFRDRLRYRENAEDQTTILLFKDEELHILFTLPNDAVLQVMDVKYSNDGESDVISLHVDDEDIGEFKTASYHAWGKKWNIFESSGPIGTPQHMDAGEHRLTLKVTDSDRYGIEIDYIRLSVEGSSVENLQKEHFVCMHNPGKNGDH